MQTAKLEQWLAGSIIELKPGHLQREQVGIDADIAHARPPPQIPLRIVRDGARQPGGGDHEACQRIGQQQCHADPCRFSEIRTGDNLFHVRQLASDFFSEL